MPERAVLLLRRRRPVGEPDHAAPTAWPFVTLLDGTASAGRISLALAELGVRIGALRQAVIDADVEAVDLGAFDLGERFDTVVLGSHLVNLPSKELRRAYVTAAVRHVARGGTVLLEHHPIDWAETAEPTAPTPGSTVGMEEVRRHPPFVSAVATYDIGGHEFRQPFTARVLSEKELDRELAAAGLGRSRRLSPTWISGQPVR